MSYRLVTYSSADRTPRAGVVIGDRVHDVQAMTGHARHATMLGVLEDWNKVQRFLTSQAALLTGSQPLAGVKLLAPILYPGAIFCAGANYTDHMQEMARVMNMPPEPDPHERGIKPWHFVKTSRGSIVGPGEAVAIPPYSKMLDWEIELAAVIGRPCKDAPIARALDYVAGYTIANDLSARDFVKRPEVGDASPFKWDWVSQKCFDGACPLGPWIVPAAEIGDPQSLAMKLWVGDELMQDSHTSRMIFNVAEQIEHLSSRITLFPGDLILTGTPAGVGMARKRFLRAGETMCVWIERIGEFTTPLV
jgi:2-keto-4-pentenoate hydratase/2-oxohepta-3-ene-1,7-dioic acid hydratase in catechol pathway